MPNEQVVDFHFSLMVLDFILLFFLKLSCLIIGFLVVKMGRDLLRDGVRGEFKFSTQLKGVKADLASASPGLLFLLLGVALIAYAVGVDKRVSDKVSVKPRVEASSPSVAVP